MTAQKQNTTLKNWLFLPFAIALMTQCAQPTKSLNNADTDEYATASSSIKNSYLRQIVANHGRADVCVQVIGGGTEQLRETYVQNVTNSLHSWTGVLKGYQD